MPSKSADRNPSGDIRYYLYEGGVIFEAGFSALSARATDLVANAITTYCDFCALMDREVDHDSNIFECDGMFIKFRVQHSYKILDPNDWSDPVDIERVITLWPAEDH